MSSSCSKHTTLARFHFKPLLPLPPSAATELLGLEVAACCCCCSAVVTDTCSVGCGVFTAVGASTTGLELAKVGSMLSTCSQEMVAATRARSPCATRTSMSLTVTCRRSSARSESIRLSPTDWKLISAQYSTVSLGIKSGFHTSSTCKHGTKSLKWLSSASSHRACRISPCSSPTTVAASWGSSKGNQRQYARPFCPWQQAIAWPSGTSKPPTSTSASPMPCCSDQMLTCRDPLALSESTPTSTQFSTSLSGQYGLEVARTVWVRWDCTWDCCEDTP
mmetsp:Transcript_30709/g.62447  ORF Transcript_30709/g.62447 Transcript_30709/m.62447 type:complete len:277 (+) Transcript_30709:223-1053(+)